MKQKKVIKSLADLSAEAIGPKASGHDETKSPQPQGVVQAPPQTPQPDFDSPSTGYRHWGLNE